MAGICLLSFLMATAFPNSTILRYGAATKGYRATEASLRPMPCITTEKITAWKFGANKISTKIIVKEASYRHGIYLEISYI